MITKHLKKSITITDTTKISILLATKKMVHDQSTQIPPPPLINTKYGNGSNDCLGTADCFTRVVTKVVDEDTVDVNDVSGKVGISEYCREGRN